MAQDAERLTELHRSARATAMPWLAVVHDERSTREWFEHVVVPRQRVTVAVRHSRVVGFAASTEGWLEQLYVAPSDQGCGVGRALLDDVTAAHPGGLQLWVFARNERARRFYETAGFVLEEQTDGQGNEEREPDCRYRWPGTVSPG